jgi:adenylyltransferase/sulfurtransferase
MSIIIPTSLRKYAGGLGAVDVDARSVGEALRQLTRMHPELESQLFDDQGQPVSYINVFVNDQNIRDLDDQDTPLGEQDEILLVPALAGG